ncbi:hypothetical protein OBK03_11855 [Empedobacter falsenii]
MKDLDVDLKKLFKHKLLTHTYYNPLLNKEESNYQTEKIINNEKYFDLLFEEYLKIEEKVFDNTFYRFSKYGTENNIENIEKSSKKGKEAFLKGDDMSKYYIQDYTKHKTISIIDNVFSKYSIYEREFLNYLKTEKSNTKSTFKSIYNLVSKIENLNIKYDVIFNLINSDLNRDIVIQETGLVYSKFSELEIEKLKTQWAIAKGKLNIKLSEYLVEIESNINNHNYIAEDTDTTNSLRELLTNYDEYIEWNEFFKNLNDYTNFLDLFTKYFEGKEYNKEIIIHLKTGAKTKFNKKLNLIQKKHSEENKLINDTKYLTFLRQIEHFKDVDDLKIIYKAIQR